jgi:hypothetical protein
MAETVDEITVTYEDNGQVTIEELDKVVLTKGGPWVTILFRYRELDQKTGNFGPPKATVKRYQKYQGAYRKRDSINLTADSSKALISSLQSWIKAKLLS